MLRAVRVELGPSAVLALACVACAACAPSVFALRREAVAAGEWGRLWSAHLVHWSIAHAMLDAFVIAVCGAIAERGFGRLFVGATLVAGAAAISIALLALTDVAEYRGASALGVLLAALAGAALWRERPAQRVWLGALGVAWSVKTLADAVLPQFTLTDLPADVRVAWPAHVAGAGVALCVLLLRASLADHASASSGCGVSTR